MPESATKHTEGGLRCKFLEVIYEGETNEFHEELPGERLDVAVYWRLSTGEVRCWSLKHLLSRDFHELRGAHDHLLYQAVGDSRQLWPIGACSPEKYETLQATTVKAQAWQTESFTFVLPESADAACVWVVLNPDADPEQPVQLLTRSLAQQLARMSDLSVATPDKLQKLMKSVLAKNKVALALISDSTICP